MERINHCYGLDPGIWKLRSLKKWKLLKDAQDSTKPRRGMRRRSSETAKEGNSFYRSYCSLCTRCSQSLGPLSVHSNPVFVSLLTLLKNNVKMKTALRRGCAKSRRPSHKLLFCPHLKTMGSGHLDGCSES